jgi:hypothetical protein
MNLADRLKLSMANLIDLLGLSLCKSAGRNTLHRNDYETDKGEKSESHEFRPIVKL